MTRTPPIEIRHSPIAGSGAFASRRIAAGARIIEYQGDRRPWTDFDDNPDNYAHLFDVGDGLVIDPFTNGNEARFINHSCSPNAEAVLSRKRIYIRALRPIPRGEEITYDYGLTLERPPTPAEIKRYPCHCGSPHCRRTLFAPFEPTDE